MTVQLIAAKDIPFDIFLRTFNLSYSDYYVPVQLEALAMQRLVKRDDIDMQASKVAVLNGKSVGVGMLAVRGDVGWIGGLGVVPDYRRRGIARQLMAALLIEAKKLNLKMAKLEVLEQNTPARALYQDLGFSDWRKLGILERQPPFDMSDDSSTACDAFLINMSKPSIALQYYDPFHPTDNPWQRQKTSLLALQDSMEAWIAVLNGKVVAYMVGWVMREGIRFMDIGIQSGQADAAWCLLHHIHSLQPNAQSSIINLDVNDTAYMVLERLGYVKTRGQYEMVLTL